MSDLKTEMLPITSNFRALPLLEKVSEGCGCGSGHSHGEEDVTAMVAEKLSAVKGKAYWRSLDELADTPEFRKYLETEFPSKHELWMDDISRRDFLKIMGAGFSMMFFAGCRRPLEKIFPYNENPESVIPGRPTYYASALSIGGLAHGVIVETHEGKPTKIEGNPQHPASLGGTDIFMQAEMLNLYDPDRSQSVKNRGAESSWESFSREIKGDLQAQVTSGGDGLRILTQTINSPSMTEQIETLLKKFPKAKWHQYEPFHNHAAHAGSVLAFGEPVATRYAFDKADVIVALDSDFLQMEPGKLVYARAYAKGRKLVEGRTQMNRLYAIEPTMTLTGSNADNRLPLRATEVETFTRALAAQLGVSAGMITANEGTDTKKFLTALTKDLQAHRGRSIVITGDIQPPVVHALVHAINAALGNVGETVLYTAPVESRPIDQLASIKELVDDMNQNRVEMLLMIDGNPVFDAPGDLAFGEALKRVKTRVRMGLYEDETSFLSDWHLNQAHSLESWNDFRAFDGTVSIAQPMIDPLYGGKTPQDLLSVLADESPRSGHDVVKDYWKRHIPVLSFDTFWKTTIHDGFAANTALPTKRPSLKNGFASGTNPAPAQGLEVIFRPDPSVSDGRYANNGWLQETPKPLTKITWDNAILISAGTADKLGVVSEDVVELSVNGQSVKAPVFINPGNADDSVTVHAGYGRTLSGRVGSNKGFNVYPLRTVKTPTLALGAEIKRTGDHYKLATTQTHHSMEGREVVRAATLEEYVKNEKFAFRAEDYPQQTLYNTPNERDTYAWAMSIDMNACIGCNACMLGCQSENNIPTVGKEQVGKGREMHWIRIDNYYEGTVEDPEVLYQPLACVHCENAPCEPVCPVGATVHSDEGINEMVYNRCVGTRYCSNNCPYKVRRFNWYQFTDYETEVTKMLNNPNVTVRERGVMEKCTYCIQRISAAKITAEKEDRSVRDGEIQTACQTACPTQAIVFGNINDEKSEVSRMKAEPRAYPLLGELNVRPRTSHLAKVRNRNPEI